MQQNATVESFAANVGHADSGRSWKSPLSPQGSSMCNTMTPLSGASLAYDEHMTAKMMRMMPKENECPQLFVYRMRVFKILCWYPFDYFIGVIILMNAVVVGIEQTLRYEDEDRTLVDVLEHCFLIVYVIELGMRVFACGSKCFRDKYVRFDVVLVALGLASTIADACLDPAPEDLGPLMILRTGRLFRLARTARLLVKFRELWIMVRGLLSSLGTIIYTMLLLLLILYTFSCISMEFITPLRDSDNIIVKEIVSTHFSNLPQTMLTLLQFVCLDSVAAIYKPIIEHQPWLVVFFVTVILVVPIVLMNLVTAVVVNGAFENAQQDKDVLAVYERQQKQRMIHELRQVFERIDGDGSGMLSTREILKMNSRDLNMLKHLTSMDEPLDIIHMLDVDGDGEIGIDEFLNGLWQVVVSKVPAEMRLELKRIQKCSREQTKELRQAMDELKQQFVGYQPCMKLVAPPDSCMSPNGRAQEAAETPIPEDTPAWAHLMVSELRAFRRDCNHEFYGSKYQPYLDADFDAQIATDLPKEAVPSIMTAAMNATSRHQFVWTRYNEPECNQFEENPETSTNVTQAQLEALRCGVTSRRPNMSRTNVVAAGASQIKPTPQLFDIPPSKYTSMWAQGMAANRQANDIENPMPE